MWWVGHPTTKKKDEDKDNDVGSKFTRKLFWKVIKNAEKFEDIGTILCLFWEEENKKTTHTPHS
jgi:hypothetical protein